MATNINASDRATENANPFNSSGFSAESFGPGETPDALQLAALQLQLAAMSIQISLPGPSLQADPEPGGIKALEAMKWNHPQNSREHFHVPNWPQNYNNKENAWVWNGSN